MTTIVSIIIPTYNRAHLINETLDSVLAQTYLNWECIIVDDGSMDNTKEIVLSYIKRDHRIKYYRRPKEKMKGAGSCRNYGLQMSSGDLINWFDDDDIMLQDFLEKRVRVFNDFPKTDIVFCSYRTFDKNGLRKKISNEKFNGNIIKGYIDSKIVFGPPSYLFRKEILKDFLYDENLQRAEDADFFLKLFSSLKSIEIIHIPEVLFYVRKHINTISLNDDKTGNRLNSQFIVRKRILDYLYRTQYEKGILKYNNRCLMDIKRLVDNKNYRLALLNIANFEYFNFKQKIYLMGCVLSQFFTGRGAYRIKNFVI
jgi:glycosyltransferase involved in cell wall biosynthesis